MESAARSLRTRSSWKWRTGVVRLRWRRRPGRLAFRSSTDGKSLHARPLYPGRRGLESPVRSKSWRRHSARTWRFANRLATKGRRVRGRGGCMGERTSPRRRSGTVHSASEVRPRGFATAFPKGPPGAGVPRRPGGRATQVESLSFRAGSSHPASRRRRQREKDVREDGLSSCPGQRTARNVFLNSFLCFPSAFFSSLMPLLPAQVHIRIRKEQKPGPGEDIRSHKQGPAPPRALGYDEPGTR